MPTKSVGVNAHIEASGGHVQYAEARIDTQQGVARRIIAHELGHIVGLKHRSTTNSVMYAYPDTYLPDDHDFDQVRAD